VAVNYEPGAILIFYPYRAYVLIIGIVPGALPRADDISGFQP